MALAFLNRCIWRAASSGSGSFVVASAITGYQVPNDCLNPPISDGDTYLYFAQSDDKTQWEIGYDNYDVTTSTLPRNNILDSSNAGSVVTFSAAPSVFMGGVVASNFATSSGSVFIDETGIVLVNDDAAPGNSYYYGTDSGGTKGFFTMPVANPMIANLDVGGFNIIGADGAAGGAISIISGAGSTVNGGAVNITSGTGDVDGGDIFLTGGAGNTGVGGDVRAVAGDSTSGDGGVLEYGGGAGVNGGYVSFEAGAGSAGDGGSVGFFPGSGSVNGGDLLITLPAAGSGRQGLIIISGLPTSDPSVTGALWSNGGVLTVS